MKLEDFSSSIVRMLLIRFKDHMVLVLREENLSFKILYEACVLNAYLLCSFDLLSTSPSDRPLTFLVILLGMS